MLKFYFIHNSQLLTDLQYIYDHYQNTEEMDKCHWKYSKQNVTFNM